MSQYGNYPLTEEYKNKVVMNQEIERLKRENTLLKGHIQAGNELLKRCAKETGMMLGEQIHEHIAHTSGGFFNAMEYHYEKPVGEQ